MGLHAVLGSGAVDEDNKSALLRTCWGMEQSGMKQPEGITFRNKPYA
jgi:hypothetical protein